ncbi:multidrug transporter MatE, partial [Intestinibacillus massiliensis]|nr:multidrug transporter MatE [Intestinibacillus massiliensis]
MNPIIENEFGTKKITPLFWKYSLLALAGQLFQSCSLIADGIFSGNGIGGIGLAAFGIIAPFLTFFAAMSGLFTTGAATMAATQLGSGDKEGARQVYGTTVAAVILFSVLFSVMAIIFREPLLTAFGA